MISESLELKVVTPEGSSVAEEAISFTACSDLGEFCILPNHRPILSVLVAGRMVVERAGGEQVVHAMDRGFLEGGPDHVNVITEHCRAAGDLDAAALQAEERDLEERLAAATEDGPERAGILVALEWVRACLDVCGVKRD